MYSKHFSKLTITVLLVLSVFFLVGVRDLWAFSVDVKNLSYADNLASGTVQRIVDYDFSAGTQSGNTIILPDSFITKPTSDTGLSYIFTPYPDPTNDITVTLDAGANRATLASGAEGGCILSSIPNLPDPSSAVEQWEFAVQLTNFTGMTDTAKAYSTQIGFGSENPASNPEFTATWVSGTAGLFLILRAAIYNDSTDQSEWSQTSAPFIGIDPATTFIELRVRIVPMTGYRDMIFEYRFSSTANWTQLGTHTVNLSTPPLHLSFPAQFPYVALHAETASGSGGDEGSETYSVWTGVTRSMTGAGITDTKILHFHLWAPTGSVTQVVATGPSLSPGSGSYTFTQTYSYMRGEVMVDDFSQDIPITINPTVGDVYDFIVTKADSSTVNSSQTIGAVIMDAPLVTVPTGHALGDANLGGLLNLTWTLPAGMPQDGIMIHGGVCADSGSENIDGTVVNATSGTITLPDLAGATGAYFEIRVHNGVHLFSNTKYDFGTCGYTQDTIPPDAPTELATSAVSASQITLSWTPSADNIGVEGYTVYRDGFDIGTTISPPFNDDTLEPSTNYCYTVKAYDQANNFSDSSNQVCAETSGPFFAHSYHQNPSSGYYIYIFAEDSSHVFSGVTINGSGLAGNVAMTYNSGNGRWEIPSVSLGTTLPTTSSTYNFTATLQTGGDPVTGSVTVSVYVEEFASNLQPTGNVTVAQPTFSWTGVAGATSYAVSLQEMEGNHVWFSPQLEAGQTSVLYDGSPLTPDQIYLYMVIASIDTDGNSNSSFAEAQFTYTGTATANQIWAESAHDNIGGTPAYYGNFFVLDSAHSLDAVTVIGPGITDVGGMALTYRDDVGEWWTIPRLNFGPDLPVNLTYSITLIDTSGEQTVEKIINGGVEDFAVPNSPMGNHAGDITFTFTGVSGAESYRIGLGEGSDPAAGGSIVWVSDSVSSGATTVMIPYNGPPLATGPYNYTVHTFMGGNSSMARAVFNYTAAAITTIILKSDSSTLAAATGPSGAPDTDVLARLDTSDTSGLTFVPVAVGAFGSITPVPAGAPDETVIVNIPSGDGKNGYFKLTFTLPTDFTNIHLAGAANVDDTGRVFLNGNPLTSSIVNSDQNTVMQFGDVAFSTDNTAFFNVGVNEILITDANTGAGPSGGSFYAIVTYGEPAKGDLDGNGIVSIDDAILAMEIMSGMPPSGIQTDYDYGASSADVNGDGKIGMAEVVYILQYVANLRGGTATPSVTPYISDANTVLLDHLDGNVDASILAYSETSAQCGPEKPSATPDFSYSSGIDGLNQALMLMPPVGEPVGSTTYLKYPGGQLMSLPNGTIEFWVYLTSYASGISLVEQGPYPGSCAGWTFAMSVNASGQLLADAWAAFAINSGSTTVPLNTWTHVAMTWGNTGAKLYLNGVQVGSDINTGMPASGYGGSVMVNYRDRAVGTQFDEIRISNVQRTTFSVGTF